MASSVNDLVNQVGARCGRKPEDVEPYAFLLTENWFDTIESLAGTNAPELQQLGIPLRFAKELLDAAKAENEAGRAGSGRKRKDSEPGRGGDAYRKDDRHASEAPRNESWHYARDGTEGGGKKAGKGKEFGGKGKRKDDGDKGKGKGKGKRRLEGCDECGGPHIAPDCPVLYKRLAYTKKLRIRVGLDPDFPLRMHLVGDKAANLKHIRDETGAWVWLNGAGSGRLEPDTGVESPDSLHLLLKSDSRQSLDDAVNIAQDLISSVYDRYREWQKESGDHRGHFARDFREGGGKGKGKGKKGDDKGGDSGCYVCGGSHFARECPQREERHNREYRHFQKVDVPVDDFDPDFHVQSRIIGRHGRNLKHIEEETGAVALLRGATSGRIDKETGEESDEPLHVLLKCDDRKGLEDAIVQAKDLIRSLDDQYDKWLNERRPHEARDYPEGGGNGGRSKATKETRDNDSEQEHCRKIPLDIDFDPAYPIAQKLMGTDARNLTHIMNKTGAAVSFHGLGSGQMEADTGEEASEPMYLLIKSDDPEQLDEAIGVADDLINTVVANYYDWQTSQEEPDKSGKRRSVDDGKDVDTPAVKRPRNTKR